ncbi:MAG TPA: hypothetical protein VK048_04145, partial [Atopostipes sp.]|nr:hypothetical protein [Atopostipes sp.]
MKGKKFYFILTAILLIGVSSIYFFRQQREEQFLAFEAYEIENIESQVLSLYNEEKTDIKSNLSENTFEEIQALFDELETEEYHPKNAERLEKAQNDFITAKEMHHLEETIDNLFIEDEMIDPEVSTQKIEQLENELLNFQEKEVYYARHMENLSEAKVQLHNIEIARSFIEGLFEEDMVREDVTRADEEEALAFIENIKNDEVRDELLAQVEILSVALTE